MFTDTNGANVNFCNNNGNNPLWIAHQLHESIDQLLLRIDAEAINDLSKPTYSYVQS